MKAWRVRSALVASMALLPLGCSSVRTPLSEEAKGKISTLDGYVERPPKLLSAEIHRSKVSSYTGGGLIPALIDAVVDSNTQDSADERLEPILAAMADFDARAEMRKALSKEMSAVPWLSGARLAEVEPLDSAMREQLLGSSEASAMLVFSLSGSLSPDFDRVQMTCRTTLLPVSKELRELAGGSASEPDPLYRGELVYKERLRRSASPDAEELRATILAGMEEIARMFVYDVELTAKREEGDSVKIDGKSCTVVRGSGGRTWARKKNGELFSISSLDL